MATLGLLLLAWLISLVVVEHAGYRRAQREEGMKRAIDGLFDLVSRDAGAASKE